MLCTHNACRCARAAELAAMCDRTGDIRYLLEAIGVHGREVECRLYDTDSPAGSTHLVNGDEN